MTGVPVAWLVARAAGLVTFGLLTLSVWLGLAMSTRLLGPKRQKTLLGLHRTLTWTGLSMLGLHVAAVLMDPVLHFGALAVLVPGTATWRPLAIALGVVSGWLTLALAASFNARRWIGQKGWRRLHYASFAAFWLALGHALLAGTDLKGFGGPLTAILAAGPVLWLTFYRLLAPRATPARASPQETQPVARQGAPAIHPAPAGDRPRPRRTVPAARCGVASAPRTRQTHLRGAPRGH